MGAALSRHEGNVDFRRTNGIWQPLIFHTIVAGTSAAGSIGRADFEELMAYLEDQRVEVITVSEGMNVS